MHELSWRLLLLAIPVLLACLILWPLAGAAAALSVLALSLLAYLAAHLYWMGRFYSWLRKPDFTSIPTGSGLWEDVFAALYQEMRRQRSSQTELSSELEQFQHAASALPDGMVLLNERDQIEWCNPPAEQQLGLSLDKDAGQPIGYLVRQTAFIRYLQAQDFHEPIKLKGLRSPDITLELLLVPFGNQQKLLLCRDITPLENLETMRRDFIANVSHELRTPLTVVGGFLETLEDMPDGVPDSTRQYLRLMQEQTTRMRHLVEDLLTLSQLESNQNVPPESTVEVSALLERIAGEARSLSNGRHQITLQAEPALRLTGVAEQLHSAFGNLVSNAVRYTPDGGSITLNWQLRGSEAVFSVSDTGIGIEPQHLGRLTERFYRVDQSRSRATGGTGLGLSIVKHILLRHQARLEITSTPGAGSTFSAVFPAVRVLRAAA